MGRNDYEEEIDLMLLGKALLKKWKMIVLVGVICAVVAVAYEIATAPKPVAAAPDSGSNDAEKAAYDERVAEIDAEIQSFRSDIEGYKVEKERIEGDLSKLDEEQDKVLEDIQKLREYRDSSVILNIDPYNTATETRTYYISTDYQIMPGMDFQNPNPVYNIVSIYTSIATSANADVNEVLHTAQGTSSDREVALCDVRISGTSNNSNDASRSCITIVTIGSDEKQAEEYMGRAVRAIEDAKDMVTAEVGEHEIILMDQSSYIGPDNDLKTAQEAFDEKLESKLDGIVSERNALNTRLGNLNTSMHNAVTGIQTQEKAKTELAKPSPSIVNAGGISKKELARWVIIGFVVGTILACLYQGVRYAVSGTIKSENELLGRFGIQTIGYEKDEVSTNVAAAAINGLVSDGDKLVVISSLGRSACEPLADKIKEKYPQTDIAVAGDVLSDADGVDSLGAVKNAVLVEKADVSMSTSIAREVQLIKDMGINIVGCVM